MAKRRSHVGGHLTGDPELLAAALVGYEQQRSEIETKMAELRRQLGVRAGRNGHAGMPNAEAIAPRKRTMSAAARKRISEASKKRWAAYRAKKAA